MPHLQTAKTLDLSNNQLTDESVKYLRKCKLENLALAHNNLTSVGFEALVPCVQKNQIRNIDLNANQISLTKRQAEKFEQELKQISVSRGGQLAHPSSSTSHGNIPDQSTPKRLSSAVR